MTATSASLLRDLRTGLASERWPEFVETYAPLIESTVRRTGVAGSDVDDVVQEVLIQCLRAIPGRTYDSKKGGLRLWLRRVTMNKAYDRLRQRTQLRSLEAAEDIAAEKLPACEEEWNREWRARMLQTAFQTVRQQFRERTWLCFSGHMLERRAATELSMALGISENAVYINSSRVLNRVKEFCAAQGEELHDVFTL
ncbi:sigma-70 family RNA polymerase sigma factor [Planctomicrobium sp. SH664]|uniref:sigma-70 family RNA polymerase sigma factor n=1 Tax=Planctomicrobium sp. SH664 TaxID=3448125 RepID=UPI003F5BD04E